MKPSEDIVTMAALDFASRFPKSGWAVRDILASETQDDVALLFDVGLTYCITVALTTSHRQLESRMHRKLACSVRERGRQKRASNGTSSESYSTADHALEFVEEADEWVGSL
jgi:hypothetical protein